MRRIMNIQFMPRYLLDMHLRNVLHIFLPEGNKYSDEWKGKCYYSGKELIFSTPKMG